MDKITYEVSGNMNSQSKTSLRNALDKIEGIQEVSIDSGRSSIEVQYNDPANASSIKECIEKSGFTIA